MYSFSNRVRYSEVNSEKELTLPSLLDYLQDCCTFESEDFGVGVDYLAKEQVAWILSSWEIKVYRYPQMGQHIKVSTWPYAFRGFYGYRNFCIEEKMEKYLQRQTRCGYLWTLRKCARHGIGTDARSLYTGDQG